MELMFNIHPCEIYIYMILCLTCQCFLIALIHLEKSDVSMTSE